MVIKKKKAAKAKKNLKKVIVTRKKAKPAAKKKKITKIAKIAKKKISTNEVLIGKVTHYFPHVEAAVIKITKDKISPGDNLHVKGHSTDFTQVVDSIQIDRVPVTSAKKGQEIGLKVISRVREHDLVYRLKT